MLTGPVAAALRAGRTQNAPKSSPARRSKTDDTLPQGHVVLVGAGPGNAGLMTLQGLRALQEADVIVHDRLVSPEVLDLARRDAARFDVGKFVGGGGATQEEINALLVEHAQRGEYVVRLKGGDPFVFGRGGEEIDHLRAHGVSFEVIPGITAAIAAGAYAGIPLTDRRHAQAVRFLTGNSDEQLAQFNFSDLAAGRETLAFYMSVGRLAALRDKLLASGVAGPHARGVHRECQPRRAARHQLHGRSTCIATRSCRSSQRARHADHRQRRRQRGRAAVVWPARAAISGLKFSLAEYQQERARMPKPTGT